MTRLIAVVVVVIIVIQIVVVVIVVVVINASVSGQAQRRKSNERIMKSFLKTGTIRLAFCHFTMFLSHSVVNTAV